MINFEIRPDAMLTAMLWAYNTNLNKSIQICTGAYPMLAQRERVANLIKVEQLKKVLEEAISEWGD